MSRSALLLLASLLLAGSWALADASTSFKWRLVITDSVTCDQFDGTTFHDSWWDHLKAVLFLSRR